MIVSELQDRWLLWRLLTRLLAEGGSDARYRRDEVDPLPRTDLAEQFGCLTLATNPQFCNVLETGLGAFQHCRCCTSVGYGVYRGAVSMKEGMQRRQHHQRALINKWSPGVSSRGTTFATAAVISTSGLP